MHPLAAPRDGGATCGLPRQSEKPAGREDSGLAESGRFAYQKVMDRDPDKPSIEELARRLAESVPAGLRSMRDELEQNFRSVLRAGLGRLDLVTREEFAVQELVLARTREKLDAMEARVADIEAAQQSPPAAKKKTRRKKKTGGAGGKPDD